MNTTKKALLCTAVILTACFLGISLFPKDNSGADQGLLRIGAGDDISGYLMDETLSHCGSTVQGEKAETIPHNGLYAQRKLTLHFIAVIWHPI